MDDFVLLRAGVHGLNVVDYTRHHAVDGLRAAGGAVQRVAWPQAHGVGFGGLFTGVAVGDPFAGNEDDDLVP